MNKVILNAIDTNVDPTSKMMNMVSITKKGDGTSVFNKTNGKRKANEKVLMENAVDIGYSAEDVVSETNNTFLIGSNYQKLQNNRIKSAINKILVAVQLAGGNDVAELLLGGVKEKAEDGTAFESQSLPWGEWVEGWEGILIRHEVDGEERFYLRVYNETNGKGTTVYKDPNGEEIDTTDKKFADFLKAPRKKSGKVNELKEALSKILDVDNPEIKESLEKMKPIRPENLNLDNIKSLRINKQSFES